MTINTQRLRRLINDSRELPWTLATSNSWRRIVDARHNSVCTPITQPDGHPDLLFFGGPDGPEAQLLIEAVNALPELLSALDAQAAEIAAQARHANFLNAEIARLRFRIAELREALNCTWMALEGYLPDHRNDVTDRAVAMARAALSGESNG